jgi:hypothetical protein
MSYYRGRYRSEAWHLDGGANDEGYHYKYCYTCARKTEHDLSNCISCGDRAIRRKKQVRNITVGDYNVKVYPNGTKYCSCKGFQFRKDCKHIKSV